jgi:hypothetical protein
MTEGAWFEQWVAILTICIAVLAISVVIDPPAYRQDALCITAAGFSATN